MTVLTRFSIVVGLLFVLASGGEARADIFAYKDAKGVLHFTNVPTRSGYRRVIRERNGNLSGVTLSLDRFDELIRSASKRYGVDIHLIRAVIKVESDFDSRARSRKGARGLMQLMPETARLHNVGDIYDPEDNIDGGVRHLKLLLERYRGDLRLTLAAYNAGIQAVEKYGGIPPYPETRQYVRRVLDYRRLYRGNGALSIEEIKR